MQLYNTATRNVEEFEPGNSELGPDKKKTVSMYTCGPTVYDYLTIGNWAAYIRWDLLARVLRHNNWNVNWIMNITDVGHLVSDADDGEDKLEKGARREGKTAWEVAEYYTADFIEGLKALDISIPHENLVKATDHIAEQIALVQKLEEKGYTYRLSDGIYFDSVKFPNYGKLAKLDIKGLLAGARIAYGDKKNPTDFAVWKFSPPGVSRDMEWDSPWGKGFPGWHLECSAIAMNFLDTPIDIHAGGIDHIPVHHTNEIAQSEAATDEKFVRFWVHSNFITIDGEKIAKSAGNGHTLADIAAKGYSFESLRMFVLESGYHRQSNFTFDNLSAAQSRLKRWQAVADLRWQLTDGPNNSTELEQIIPAISAALNDNLDTPSALAAIERALSILEQGISKSAEPSARKLFDTIRDLLGIDLLASADISDEVKELIAKREIARMNKDFASSDASRDALAEQGIEIRDTPHGSFWARA